MTFSEMMNIGLMQGFAGLSLFAVLLLMGLGLAIIRNSIEQCGGSVFCANEKPRGFSVTMIFPCGQRGE